MSINRYTVGKVARISGAFTDADGVAVDPSTVTLKYRPPGGPVVTKTLGAGGVVRDDTGAFHYDVDLNAPGRWTYRWEATGPKTAGEGELYVAASMVD